MNQNALPWHQPGNVTQTVPGGEKGDRNRGSLGKAQAFWLGHDEISRRHHVRGETAGRHSNDFLADCQTVYPFAQRSDHSGTFAPRRPCVTRVDAKDIHDVPEVEASGTHTHLHLAWSRTTAGQW